MRQLYILNFHPRQVKQALIDGVGSTQYVGHESYEELREYQLEHSLGLNRLSDLNPKDLQSCDLVCEYSLLKNLRDGISQMIEIEL